jgi:hypothetical protein
LEEKGVRFERNSPSDEFCLGNFPIAIGITSSHHYGRNLVWVSIALPIRYAKCIVLEMKRSAALAEDLKTKFYQRCEGCSYFFLMKHSIS